MSLMGFGTKKQIQIMKTQILEEIVGANLRNVLICQKPKSPKEFFPNNKNGPQGTKPSSFCFSFFFGEG